MYHIYGSPEQDIKLAGYGSLDQHIALQLSVGYGNPEQDIELY